MQSPNNSDDSRQSSPIPRNLQTIQSHRRSSTTTSSTRQPRFNPHLHLLHRTEGNCSKHLTDCQLPRWLKAGKKASRNLQLVQQLPTFQWSTSHYHQPIHIHHLTPHSTIENVLDKIRNVTVYVIDTESDPPSSHRPEPLPALLQIQAIHNPTEATILLIETQHLPHSSTFTYFNNSRFSICPTYNNLLIFNNTLPNTGMTLILIFHHALLKNLMFQSILTPILMLILYVMLILLI